MIPVTVDNLVALSVQAGVLALAGAPLPWLFGLRSPRARLAYWRALLLACLVLPAIQPWAPRVVPAAPAGSDVVLAVPGVDATEAVRAPAGPSAGFPRAGLLHVVAAGAIARSCWFACGLATLALLRRRSSRLEPRPASVVDAVGMARADAEFRVAAGPTRPVTFGFLRPVVVVPNDFHRFGEDEQKAIACHELIHVRRRDWLRNLADELVRMAAWFHPAAWWLTRQVRLAREEVVDQEVVHRLGVRKPYLDALLRLASPDRGTMFVPAPLFLGRSHLADRVALLLKEVRMSRPRLAVSFVAMSLILSASGLAAVRAFPLHGNASVMESQEAGAARPGQLPPRVQPRSKPAETMTKVKDVRPAFPTGSADTPVVLKLEVDASGAVIAATPTAGPADLAEVAVAAARQWRFSRGRAGTVIVGFNPAAGGALANQPPVLVGPGVKPPAKVKDVRPIYPEEARKARVQGLVILETRIAADGAVAEARVLRSVPELDEAALQAVLGWRFTPGGMPMQMTVTVNFTLDSGPKGVPGGAAAGGGQSGEDAPKWSTLESAEQAVRIGGAIKPPTKTVDVKPVYPADALAARLQGVVVMQLGIGADGKVKEAKVLRSVPGLDEAALDAVRQWEFTPTIVGGGPKPVIMTVTVNFRLE